ncbi:PREDICTED: zinc-finger homeodomain protein 6 [Populus euphratica]|uniref:Zinc-finger homeodomain protein 6 n=1 Tax=Populus euphratica TaxID=75702 RepID=A0AAJ6X380_POPEU|nr:PREDICTED: zinc-finger homeodomain protein 6 [Populus euphratica]XP_011003724.1 PREDICTED: zinc-finger homeodomain protein 6 [Populus euphratica]XP_011003725.1 PREDICTED: zinc-finger homeodomain protein 6 [Populus euphratica]XP_011003726.1 PREDICTED: zinc-finger homeodomain protein 6 [Populus euphratica]XP_011003727.1 PREDICTED: zinc-finger homeodomain protein 6 [Populus euphratica]XP_011003728.1 PREDICTED: zinc-finger homeodomain protein 6 [Populus euphratica]
MELRGQDKERVMPRSLNYNPPNNRDSSSRIPSAPTRRDHRHTDTVLPHTLDLEHQSLYQPQQQQQLNPQHQACKPTRDLDLTPDPTQAITPVATTSATNTAPTPSRSISRSPPPTSASSASIRYRECLKNHAASMGGHVLDGCGEFMPGGEEGTPETFKCAACECHRSFHRREIDGAPQCVANSTCYKNSNGKRNILPLPQQLVTSHAPPQSASLHPHQRCHHGTLSTYTTPIAPMMMSFGGGGGAAAESSSEDLNMYQSDLQGQSSVQPLISKKRFRTRFSEEQKDKMMEFAEKLGWRIQKQDEQEVQQFCSQVDVKRKVFKVWMHNNKQAMKKKQT